FFQTVLGKYLKYSCGYWDQAEQTLDDAEAAMLALTCERAALHDGQRILELGCGWGAVTLWMAEQYPASQIVAVSNSNTQKRFIDQQAAARRLSNVQVITADINDFSPATDFDRVVSVEMFEHARNYQELMRRIASWLAPAGQLFVHIFCHREFAYPFEERGRYDWMSRYFFTGGTMPSETTLLQFQDRLTLDQQWRVSGLHYARTANAWLRNTDDNREAVLSIFKQVYGPAEADRWLQRWRMFFMACAELFGYANGEEWLVGHYRFEKPAP
ncbi:MAG: class I SAM-dependent methyltransferase, partial [Gammaproteobacteria bacterium]|nr:class I SAM-dependent methyltransferase [Gammaproteobacteria bacterium]